MHKMGPKKVIFIIEQANVLCVKCSSHICEGNIKIINLYNWSSGCFLLPLNSIKALVQTQEKKQTLYVNFNQSVFNYTFLVCWCVIHFDNDHWYYGHLGKHSFHHSFLQVCAIQINPNNKKFPTSRYEVSNCFEKILMALNISDR